MFKMLIDGVRESPPAFNMIFSQYKLTAMGGTVSFDITGQTMQNDLIFVFTASTDTTNALTGFTSIALNTQAGTSSMYVSAWYKVADGTETTVSMTGLATEGTKNTAIVIYRPTYGTPYLDVNAGTFANEASSQVIAPAISGMVQNATVFNIMMSNATWLTNGFAFGGSFPQLQPYPAVFTNSIAIAIELPSGTSIAQRVVCNIGTTATNLGISVSFYTA